MAFQIRPVRTDFEIKAAAELFESYAASLPVRLDYQDFESELSSLPGEYSPPHGELLLAWDEAGNPLGCVALRRIPPDACCEMKRLFVLPRARGLGLGRSIAQAIIERARRLGYSELRLDTLPTMEAAISMNEHLGFKRIGAYYAPTPDGTIFMSLVL
jgi:GNAT superfamily N-acetyltransferase